MGFGKDGMGVILNESRTQALGALAASVGIFIGTAAVTLERFRIIKSEVIAMIIGLTAGEGSGLYLYLVDGDLSLAEAEQAIEQTGPLGPNDAPAAEVALRYVKLFGNTDHEIATEAVIHNQTGGGQMSETIRWTFARTKAWNWMIYNQGVAITTGATVKIKSKNFGVWVT